MRFHHMAIFTSDLDAAIRLWRDVMGFKLYHQAEIPDGEVCGPGVYLTPALLDDIFGVKDARSHMALLISDEGAIIELQQCSNPQISKTPATKLRYGQTGIRELGLYVDDIDAWHHKIKTAGYELQTDYVWPCAGLGRSFIFYDDDGNMIQLWEDT
ncbi:MAG: VOC family protein [Pseudomonadota bacterium]